MSTCWLTIGWHEFYFCWWLSMLWLMERVYWCICWILPQTNEVKKCICPRNLPKIFTIHLFIYARLILISENNEARYILLKKWEKDRDREKQYIFFLSMLDLRISLMLVRWTNEHFNSIISNQSSIFYWLKRKLYIYICVCVCVFHWFISFIYFIYLFLLFISFLFSFPFSFSLRVERIFKKKPFTHGSKRGKMNLSSSLHG